MRVMSKKESELLDKLTRLAFGNSSLVDEAIRTTSAGKTSVPLSTIVDYIMRHRATRKPQRKQVEQEKLRAAAG